LRFLWTIIGLLWTLTLQAQTPAEKKTITRAEDLMAGGEYRLALNELLKGLKVNPQNLKINYLLGQCYEQIGQKAKAFPHIEKVIRHDPKFAPDLYYRYASLLLFKMELDSAIIYFRKDANRFKPQDKRRKPAELGIRWCENAKKAITKPVPVKVENLGPNINTRFPEYCPVINATETVLYFTSRRSGNVGNYLLDDLPLEDVYYARRDQDGNWSPARNVGTTVNTENNDATVNLSVDGQTALIYREGDLLLTKLKGTQWQKPEMLPQPISTDLREASATFSPDNKTIYFDRDDEALPNDKDIYYSTLQKNGKWSAPKPLIGINTPDYDEGEPFLHPDGKTLYFSSNGKESIGGYDIFKSERQADGTWSKPVNLGYPINTTDDDRWLIFTADGRHAYYSSAQEGGYGETDIYRVTFDPPKEEKATPHLTLLKGIITDERTKKPLEATIYIVDNDKNDTLAVFNSNSETGEYLISLPNGKNYGVLISTKGYLFRSENVFLLPEKGFEEKTVDFGLRPVEYAVGQKFILKNIFYDFDKATLRKSSIAELERLRKILLEYPNMHIRILGHTDSLGTHEYNRTLSHNRAKAVVDYLISKGIPESRLDYQGFGEEQPIDTNATDTGRQNNRRTEFEIVKM
jgi:outer membrane protein OmpA-like peptidoglycan-associated protein/tetratricopeptide (TPR) repeat protein